MSQSLAEEAANPRTTPQRMREIIKKDRSLYVTVACNPNVDEPLRQWLWTNGGTAVQEAMVEQYERAVKAQEKARAAKKLADLKAKDAQKATQKPASNPDLLKNAEKAADVLSAPAQAAPSRRSEAKRKHAEQERDADLRAVIEKRQAEEAARLKAIEEARLTEEQKLQALRDKRDEEERRLAEVARRREEERQAVNNRARVEQAARDEEERRSREAAIARVEEEKRLREAAIARAKGQDSSPSAVNLENELASIQAEVAQGRRSSVAAQQVPQSDFLDEDDETIIVNAVERPISSLLTADGETINLTQDIVILGRKPRGPITRGAQVVNLNVDRTVSKTHARLVFHDGDWYITDLNSTNGVSLGRKPNDVEITPDVEVKVEGEFTLGPNYTLTLVAQR
ncbi:MAG: FHA domain-containing protein [Actinomycetaceae bacterium]|nr:FHA domain-containing protein [Actinomycetaceae bacterium]